MGNFTRRLGAILRKIADLLYQHGGFPQGLPGLMRQTLALIRQWGLLGLARKIWQSAPAYPPQAEPLPLLGRVLAASDNPLPRLLDASHAPVCVVEHDWGGGADAYCRDRVAALLAGGRNGDPPGRAVLRLRYAIQARRLELTVCYGEERFRCEVSHIRELADYRFPRIVDFIINELAGWHLKGFRFAEASGAVLETVCELTRIVVKHKARLEFLFHDYYPVCPTINLLTPKLAYCGLNANDSACDRCALRGEPFSMAAWRKTWRTLLEQADEVVFFSEDSRDRVLDIYPLRREQIRIRPHEVKALGEKLPIAASGPMRVAVAGHIQIHKGSSVVLKLARIMKTRMPDASIVVFGKLDASGIPENVTVLGEYKKSELHRLLREQKVTVGFFSSIWPETFSFVVHELASVGLPLVCFDIGAPGAYVRTLPDSRVARLMTAESAFAALRELDAVRRAAR